MVLTLSNVTVTEGDSVDVCLELFNKRLITGNASATLITDNSQSGATVTGLNKKFSIIVNAQLTPHTIN